MLAPHPQPLQQSLYTAAPEPIRPVPVQNTGLISSNGVVFPPQTFIKEHMNPPEQLDPRWEQLMLANNICPHCNCTNCTCTNYTRQEHRSFNKLVSLIFRYILIKNLESSGPGWSSRSCLDPHPRLTPFMSGCRGSSLGSSLVYRGPDNWNVSPVRRLSSARRVRQQPHGELVPFHGA